MKNVKRNTLEGLAAWASNLDLASIKAGDGGTGGEGGEENNPSPSDPPKEQGPPIPPPTT